MSSTIAVTYWAGELSPVAVKPAFHDADTDNLARIVARMSACRSACHRNNFKKSHVSDAGPDLAGAWGPGSQLTWGH